MTADMSPRTLAAARESQADAYLVRQNYSDIEPILEVLCRDGVTDRIRDQWKDGRGRGTAEVEGPQGA